MPPDRLVLPLRPGPRAAQEARRWVDAMCADLGRTDLVECAQLGVSELVTNALLHGAPPIELRVRGTHEHPRFEVRDSSPDAPLVPRPRRDAGEGGPHDRPARTHDQAAVLDDALMTFGRGLDIVARASDAWGTDLEADGKVVWFTPAPDVSEVATPATITGATTTDAAGPSPADPVTVEIIGVPPRLFDAFHLQLRELRREVRLLALSHESAHPIATDLADLFGSLERHVREVIGVHQLEDARAQGVAALDLTVTMSQAATRSMPRFLELLDLADEFCRERRLLAQPRSPEQRLFQHWLLGEFVRQGAGEAPRPWVDADPAVARHTVVS